MANVEVILTFDDGPDTRSGSANGTDRVLSALESNPTGHALNAVFFIQTHAKNNQNNYFRGMHSFNRTSLELRRCIQEDKSATRTFTRTSLELKLNV